MQKFGAADPEDRATLWLIDMQSEMSIYLRRRAVYVCLLAPKGQAKHGGILTYFQTKVKKKRLKKELFLIITACRRLCNFLN